jgi:NTP pyrophosphatase (non-canonical NTP hydrolase)
MNSRSPDINDMMEAQAAWIETLLAGRDPRRTVIKLAGEVAELMEATTLGTKDVASEIADILILVLDVAKLYKIDPAEAFYDKLDINKRRTWQPSGGCLQHNKEG